MSKIILIRGMAGTGKTTLANELGKMLKIMVLHKDDLYDILSIHIDNHTERNTTCFEILFKMLKNALNCGADLIIDFGYNHLDDVEKIQKWIEQHNGEMRSILCTCDDKVWEERLNQRKENPLPNQLLTDIGDLKKHYSKMRTGVLQEELVVDTSLNVSQLVDRAVKYI